jgi:ATP-dependent helicase/nuclease subunit A
MSAASTRWTPQQRAAIEHVDGALLVSAAAGSGKTAVLAERCAYLVCDAPEPCDVDELLVLTFTRAAAAEMRERIDGVIRRRASEPDAPARLHRQLRLIDRAPITTLDAFCGQLVRSHFHLVGVDPAFALLAPEDAAMLRVEVADSIIEAEYDGPDAPLFRQLLDCYFRSEDAELRSAMIGAHQLLQSVVDPEQWTTRALRRLEEASTSTDAPLLAEYADVITRALAAGVLALEQVARRAAGEPATTPYARHALELVEHLKLRTTLAAARRFDDLAALTRDYKPPKLPTIKADAPGKQVLQASINAVKDEVKDGALRKLCLFSTTELREGLTQIVPFARKFFDLVEHFGKSFDSAKQRQRALDFADIERLALQIVRAPGPDLTPSPAAHALHRRYRHVLVDEFQDINPLQNAILRLLSRDRASQLDTSVASNFFSVGDVKQSIYGFRLADPRQFIDRHATLRASPRPEDRVIDLQENFRSRPALLEAVNDVFRLLMTAESADVAYDQTQELRSITDYPPVEGPHFVGKPIELHLLPAKPAPADHDDSPAHDPDEAQPDRFEREIEVIARRIQELVHPDISRRTHVMEKSPEGLRARPIRYGDIAVLLRTRRIKSSQLAEALRERGIPVHSDDATGFFSSTEVQDVLSVLRLLSNGRQDIPMAAVIRSPFSGVTDKEDALARIRLAAPDEAFHRAVVRYTIDMHDALADELRALLATLDEWRRLFQEQPIGESLLRLYGHNHFLTFCRSLPDGEQRVANLGELLRRGETFDSFERQGLDRFLQFLEDLAVDDQLGRPAVASESADVVRVMTVHKSKGLEFPVVIIPDLGKKINFQSLQSSVLLNRDAGIGMQCVDLPKRVRYPSAASMVVQDRARRQAIAEEIRVLYVALTRAREHLILIGTAKADALEQWRDAWAEHPGRLPDAAIQSAKAALDWLGPIAAITQARGLDTFEIHDLTAGATPASPDVPPAPPTEQSALPPSLPSLDDPLARRAVERVTYLYPHRLATTLPLTQRVSVVAEAALARAADVPLEPLGPPTLEWPEAYRRRERPKSVDIGTATHLALQHLDFANALTADAVRQQLADTVARRLLSDEQARIVNVDAIVWFAQTPLAALFSSDQATVLREQAFALNVLAPESDIDVALLRGRVDALIVTPAGLTFVDYKSDRVDASDAPVRAVNYFGQMMGYANALCQITGRPVVGVHLVFLQARRIIRADV